jgi:putative FmdB family regulatory protein
MPIYEYECSNCGKRFEKMQSITADPLTECMHCGSGPIRRVMHPVGVIFKGSGWYITDSRKSSGSEGSSGSKEGKEAGPKSESDSKSTEASSSKDASSSKPSGD